jgi:hypothetical protein
MPVGYMVCLFSFFGVQEEVPINPPPILKKKKKKIVSTTINNHASLLQKKGEDTEKKGQNPHAKFVKKKTTIPLSEKSFNHVDNRDSIKVGLSYLISNSYFFLATWGNITKKKEKKKKNQNRIDTRRVSKSLCRQVCFLSHLVRGCGRGT